MGESEEERNHAEQLIDYQNKRGGRVVLGSLMSPITEFDEAEKGEALYSMELSLSLEKLNYEKLVELHRIADMMGDQVESINKVAKMLSQLRRIGKGHAVWHFDQ